MSWLQVLRVLRVAVHNRLGQGLVVVTTIDLSPIKTGLSGAFLTIVIRAALLKAQHVGPPLGLVGVHIHTTRLDHVAFTLVGTMLTGEGAIRVLSGVAIGNEVDISDVHNTSRRNGSCHGARIE